ncbi:MAG: MFS transporter [Deltaproteobacteria bacterium]|nr:MFS transporter [Deltaproteobacteria bacterium]
MTFLPKSRRRFLPMLATLFLGALNDNFFKNALIVLITFRGVRLGTLEPNMVVALAAGLFILPFFLFSGTAGQLADRMEKSALIRTIKLIELGVMSLAGLGFFLESFGLLLFVLFLLGMQSALFGPLKFGILPDLVPEEELVSANAFVAMGTFIAILLGTIAGGLATQIEGGTRVASGGGLVVALLGILASRYIPPVPRRSPNLPIDWTLVRSTWDILRRVLPNRPILNTILGISWFWFLGTGVLSLLPGFVKEVLQGGEQVVTAMLALFTLGIGIGSFLCDKLSFGRVEVGVIPFGVVGMSAFLLDLSWVGSNWSQGGAAGHTVSLLAFLALPGAGRAFFDLFLTAVCGGVFIVPLYSFLQVRGNPAHLSRIIAATNIISSLVMVLSVILLGTLHILQLNLPEMFLVFAALNVAVSIKIFRVVPEFSLRFLGWVMAHVMYRIRVEGREHIPDQGPVLLTCNHVSFVDWLIIYSECKRPVRFVMDYQFFRIPLLRQMCGYAKVIPIATSKEDPALMEAAFDKVSLELAQGEVVGIFPEGRISADGAMTYFRPGLERILHKDPALVVPMALHGLWGSVFSRAKSVSLIGALGRWRREIVLHIGAPVPPEQATAKVMEAAVRQGLARAQALARP